MAGQRIGGYFTKKVRECPERVSKDAMPRTYPPDRKLPPTDFAVALIESGLRHETRIVARLAGSPGVRAIERPPQTRGRRPNEELARQEQETIAALDEPHVSVIIGGRLGGAIEHRRGLADPRPPRVSEPDLLLVSRRADGTVESVVPGDVKDHKVLSGDAEGVWPVSTLEDLGHPHDSELAGAARVDDGLQLAHYWRHLESLGLAHGVPRGFVIGREESAVWIALGDFLVDYDELLAEGQRIVAAATAADAHPATTTKATFPLWSNGCEECPWRAVCVAELRAHGRGGHVSLVAGVTRSDVAALADRGITDVSALADDPEVLGPAMALAARSALHDEVYATGPVDLRRADVEIDFDLENSMGPADGSAGEGLVYLWGTLESVAGREPVFRAFDDYTDTPAGEVSAFGRFFSFLSESRRRAVEDGRSWRAFHYSGHEVNKIRELYERHAGDPGMPPRAEVDALLGTGDIVDLLKLLKKQTIWPTLSYSIKKVAPRAGFSWRAPDAGGGNSTVWYAQAVSDPDPRVRDASRQKLLEYNEDDVVAQLVIRDWLDAQIASGQVPVVGTGPA